MPDYRDFVGGDFLKADDFRGRNPVRVLIESVKPEVIKNDSGEETKLVARFAGKEKGLTLNKTNMEMLAFLSNSTDYEQWRGLQCELYHDPTVKMGSKVVGGLRLRQSSAPVFLPPPPAEDDVPF